MDYITLVKSVKGSYLLGYIAPLLRPGVGVSFTSLVASTSLGCNNPDAFGIPGQRQVQISSNDDQSSLLIFCLTFRCLQMP